VSLQKSIKVLEMIRNQIQADIKLNFWYLTGTDQAIKTIPYHHLEVKTNGGRFPIRSAVLRPRL